VIKTIGSIFILGLSFGAGPCLVSCGPILLSYIAGTKKNVFKGIWVYILFSCARIVSYLVLSLAVFYLGRFAEQRLFGALFYKYVVLLGGLFILVTGVLMALGKKWEFKLWQFLYRNILERDQKSVFLLGLVIGLLPCGPLLAILSYLGLISKNWLQSVTYGLSFGLGTFVSPLILLVLLAGIIPKFLTGKIYRIFSFICGLIIIFFGLQLIFRFFYA
jgi:sulfite exporter TauE/SafE